MTRLALAALLAFVAPAQADTGLLLSGPVTRVRDGDTVVVTEAIGGRPIAVRLKGIVSPELSEPGGREAKTWLEQAILGKRVTCSLSGEASYDRLVGYCVTYADVGDALIAAGQARRCPAFDPERRYPDGNATLPLPPYCRAPKPEPKPEPKP